MCYASICTGARRTIVFAFLFSLFFLRAGGASADQPETRLELKITGIDKSLFPQIKMKAYLHDTKGNSENRVSAGKFTLLENRVPQRIDLRPTDSHKITAVVVDRGMYSADYAPKVQSCIDKTASYLENLDKLAVYSFTDDMRKCDFSSNPDRFKNLELNGEDARPEKPVDEVIGLALDQMSDFAGEKNIVYLTADPIWFGENLKEKIQSMNASQSVSVNIVKAGVPVENARDNSTVLAQMHEFAAATGGQYVEVPAARIDEAVGAVMERIKSNYEIAYTTSMPYSNGQKRSVRLEADYLDRVTAADSEYLVDFNLPELDFGDRARAFFYQEINPSLIEKASELGLSISFEVIFRNNARTGNPVNAEAHLGFGAFAIDGKPTSQERFEVSVNNVFKVTASKYVLPPIVNTDYLEVLPNYEVREERTATQYPVAAKNGNIKRAGIFWTKYFKNDIQSQWVRAFMTFTPRPVVTDGSVRYAIFIYGKSLDGTPKEIDFDGIQMQYGFVPTIYTDEKTFYMGPDDVRKTIVKPMNPRIEYQMK